MITLRLRGLLKHVFPLFCLSMVFSGMLRGQQQLYQGVLKLGKYHGNASYQYLISDRDTIFDGTFLFEKSSLEALLKKEDVSFAINGNFLKNTASGLWNLRFNTFQSSNSSSLKNNEYVVRVNGVQEIASGYLDSGKPNGEWTYVKQNIKNSEVEKTLFKSILYFNKGVSEQNFTIENEEQKLVGRFLRNGLAHDTWSLFSFTHVDETESWNFKDGILESIDFIDDSRSERIKIHGIENDESKTKIVKLDSTYLEILKMNLSGVEEEKLSKSGMLLLLAQNDAYYKSIQDVLTRLRPTAFKAKFNVKIPHYPMDSREVTSLKSILENYNEAQKISERILNNTEIDILRLYYKKIGDLEDTVEKINKTDLKKLSRLMAYQKKDMLVHADRPSLYSKIWPNGIPNKKKNQTSIDAIEKLAKISSDSLDAIQKILSKTLNRHERKQEASKLENQMITQRDYLKKLDTVLSHDTIPLIYRNTIKNIINNTEQKLKTYAAIKILGKKLDYARELVYCFEKWDKVGNAITNLHVQQYKVQKAYLDKVWNPFTATIMTETVKKRLLYAYERKLIPYYLEQVEKGLACEEIEQWIDTMDKLYARMIKLRDEETDKLERKLKKEDKPQYIFEYIFSKTKGKIE